MACVVCKRKRKEPGLGVERTVDPAFRKIEKVEEGVLWESEEEGKVTRRAGQGQGRGLGLSPGVCVSGVVLCQLEVRKNPEQRRIMGRFEFGKSLLLPHWGGLAGY